MAGSCSCRSAASASSIRTILPSTNVRHRCTSSKSLPTARPTGANLSGQAPSSPELPPLVRDLTIDYTAPSLVAPRKVRFRFKLEGQDRDWREVLNDRRVQYSNLAPGNYTFLLRASNNSGVWNEDGAVAPLLDRARVLPDPLVLRARGALAGLPRCGRPISSASARSPRAYKRRLDERVSERTRIARELHDTLLQSFHGSLLRFQTASHLLPERAAEAKEKLDRAIEGAAEAITEGRNAVQGLRTSTVERNDLAAAIRTLGDELVTDASAQPPPAFRVTVEGRPRDLHPIVRDDIYKIAAEALRNAFRHAQAGQVESRSATTKSNSGCACATTARGSIPRCWPTRASRGTTDCAACRNARR